MGLYKICEHRAALAGKDFDAETDATDTVRRGGLRDTREGAKLKNLSSSGRAELH